MGDIFINTGAAADDSTGDSLRELGTRLNAVFGGVISRTTDFPSVTASEEDIYIVPAGATSSWNTLDGQIAYYDGGAWNYRTPVEGWLAYVADEARFFIYNGSSWETLGTAFRAGSVVSKTASWTYNSLANAGNPHEVSTSGGDVTMTLETQATTLIPRHSVLIYVTDATNDFIVAGDTGITVNNSAGGTVTISATGFVIVTKVDDDEWYVIDLTGTGGGGASAINDLSDVTISSPASGEVLKYNGSVWANAADAGGGTIALSSALEFVAEYTASTSSSLDVPLADSTVDRFLIQIEMAFSADGTDLDLQVTDDNFSTIESGASDYQYSFVRRDSSATAAQSSAAAQISIDGAVGNAAGERCFYDMHVFTPGDAAQKTGFYVVGGAMSAAGALNDFKGAGEYQVSSTVNGLRLTPSSGTMTGKVRVFKYTDGGSSIRSKKITSSFTLAPADAGYEFQVDSTSAAIVVTIPKVATTDLPDGFYASFVRVGGANAITFECEDANVDINGVADEVVTLGTTNFSSVAFLSMVADTSGDRVDDEFIITGDVSV